MSKVSFLSLFFFCCRLLLKNLKRLRSFQRSYSSLAPQSRYQKYSLLLHRSDLPEHTLIFQLEDTLLKSCSLFPYFMLVAFEAGGLLRATILLLLYPALCLVSDEVRLKMMVMVCFFGIKKETFRAGRAVLPKFFLEDVGLEMFELLKKGRKKVAVTQLPRIMVESFAEEYLEMDHVIGSELKVCGGYFIGLMAEKNTKDVAENVPDCTGCDAIGVARFNKIHAYGLFSRCKDIYLVSEADKKTWKNLPREKYPKALIFHDGRLVARPTPLETLASLMWIPFAFLISVIRITLAFVLPYDLSTPLLSMSGLRLVVAFPLTSLSFSNIDDKQKGHLYVCNHKTLLDPLYLAFALKKNLIAVTYSLSRMSEILAPIKTVRLTRNRGEDAEMMKKLLNEGDLVVCPEGTTCREPYLLRFSPLFSEMCDEMIPVAIDTHVSMFHGTTAGGLKCMDPFFFLMNPTPVYTIQVLDKVSSFSSTENDHKSRFDVANHVQDQLGKALGFKCTTLTRKDKYMILAGNQGIVPTKAKH